MKIRDVAVIGAGVFGAWTALELIRAGRSVVLLDQYGAASARASSGGESRVIRMAYGPDAVYTRMSMQSLGAWQALFADVGEPELFCETGVLSLATADSPSPSVLSAHDVRHEVLDGAALARRFPSMAVSPGDVGILEPGSGALFARRAVQAVVAECRRKTAEFRIEAVSGPMGDSRSAEVRTVSGEAIRAGQFVYACGPWLGRVLPEVLRGRIFPTRQEVFYFGTPPGDRGFAPPALPTWLDMARGYYGIPDIDGRGFKIACDAHGEIVDPDTQERAPTPQRIAHARDFLAQRFPALASAPLLGAEVCQYENTANGDFVIDRHPGFDNVWIAGGGSGHGFKHGPAVGAYLVERMLRDGPAEPRFSLASKGIERRREVH